MATTTVYPNGDGTKTNWVGTGDASNFYANIDEGTASPNDSDMNSSLTSLSEIYFLLGDMPTDFSVATAVTIRVRLAGAVLYKDDPLHFNYCQLVQSNESTAITATATITDSSVPATYAFTPTITGATDKTTWDGARLKFKLGSSVSGGGTCYIYAAQIEITYTTSGGASATISSTMMW